MSTGSLILKQTSIKAVYDISDNISTEEYRKPKVIGMIFESGEGKPIFKKRW